jgi:hypothetical protein
LYIQGGKPYVLLLDTAMAGEYTAAVEMASTMEEEGDEEPEQGPGQGES